MFVRAECDREHCSLSDTGDSEGEKLTIGLNLTLVCLTHAVLLVSLAKTGRTHILPDFTGQLYQNTAPESHEAQTAQAIPPVPPLSVMTP